MQAADAIWDLTGVGGPFLPHTVGHVQYAGHTWLILPKSPGLCWMLKNSLWCEWLNLLSKVGRKIMAWTVVCLNMHDVSASVIQGKLPTKDLSSSSKIMLCFTWVLMMQSFEAVKPLFRHRAWSVAVLVLMIVMKRLVSVPVTHVFNPSLKFTICVNMKLSAH